MGKLSDGRSIVETDIAKVDKQLLCLFSGDDHGTSKIVRAESLFRSRRLLLERLNDFTLPSTLPVELLA